MSPPAPYGLDKRYSQNDSQPRRILHVVFSSRIAGSERYCVDLANRQAALGHEVHVACMRASPIPHAVVPAVRVHCFRRFFRGLLLRRLIRRLQPDICHGHLSAACKALGGLRAKPRTVATLHVGYKPHQHAKLDGVICVNRTQAGRLSGYAGMARTIANWLPAVPEITPLGIREELGLGPDVFLVGAVGRLHESKGTDVLVNAFKKAAPATARLVMLGEGPQRAHLEKLRDGDPRIHLVGYRPIVQGFLQDLDLCVSPSREESFGLAIVEAMGTGLPIIATAAEGPAEYLRDQPATLVSPVSIDEMADALAAACEQFGTGRPNRVSYDLSLFHPDDRVANVMDFYTDVIESGPADQGMAVAREIAIAT